MHHEGVANTKSCELCKFYEFLGTNVLADP